MRTGGHGVLIHVHTQDGEYKGVDIYILPLRLPIPGVNTLCCPPNSPPLHPLLIQEQCDTKSGHIIGYTHIDVMGLDVLLCVVAMMMDHDLCYQWVKDLCAWGRGVVAILFTNLVKSSVDPHIAHFIQKS